MHGVAGLRALLPPPTTADVADAPAPPPQICNPSPWQIKLDCVAMATAAIGYHNLHLLGKAQHAHHEWYSLVQHHLHLVDKACSARKS